MSMELTVSKSLLNRIKLGDKFTITCKDVDGKQIKETLTVNGICSKGVIDLSWNAIMKSVRKRQLFN